MTTQLPDDFKCPISLEIMSDPVILSSGHTFDRASIQRWIDAGHRTCPVTKLPLPDNPSLIPNHALRSLISNYTLVSLPKPQPYPEPQALISTLTSPSSCLDSKLDSLDQLAKLSKRDSAFRRKITESGAVSAVLKCAASEYPSLQEKALSLLLNLSLDDDNKVGLVAEGAIARIVAALQTGSADSRAVAATTLTSLAVVEVNKATIGAYPCAIRALVSLLRGGTGREKKEAATALYALCSFPDNRRRAVQCGAVPILIRIADAGDEFYYRFLEDIALMKEVGFESFRFSISWSRILPKGKLSGGVNQEGVAFYNDLINELLYQGLQPFVTLFHWDLPQALEDDYLGLLSPNIVDDYRDYADFCFKEFGDRVKFWTTFNEPHTFAEKGYATGTNAPGRCSNYSGNCTFGNSGTEPYIVGHHILLSHAAAVRLYREKYQASQQGKIGITLDSQWMVPKFDTVASSKAALRALDFFFGWYANPLTFGDYPETMRALVGDRLPKFTASQSEMVKGSLDFLGVNYYTARYADNITSSTGDYPSYTTDSHVNLTTEKDGVLIGEPTASSWLYIYPRGIRELVLYINRTYNPPPIYITENGLNDKGSLPLQDALDDIVRLKYHRSHMSYVLEAIKAGVDVRGYLAWSFLDNFEWESGYTLRFGLTYVDYENGLRRYYKRSALWFKNFLQKENATRRPHLLYTEY